MTIFTLGIIFNFSIQEEICLGILEGFILVFIEVFDHRSSIYEIFADWESDTAGRTWI